ncbi:8822_t:CDS:2, partial [Gigaspora rosea]
TSRMQYNSPWISLQPDFDITTIEIEQSLLGGAWSLAAIAYKLLL